MLMFRSPKAEDILSADNYSELYKTVLEEGLKQGHFTEEDRGSYLEAWSQPGALTGGLNYYRASRVAPSSIKDGNLQRCRRQIRLGSS